MPVFKPRKKISGSNKLELWDLRKPSVVKKGVLADLVITGKIPEIIPFINKARSFGLTVSEAKKLWFDSLKLKNQKKK